jgi:hypothetical protein
MISLPPPKKIQSNDMKAKFSKLLSVSTEYAVVTNNWHYFLIDIASVSLISDIKAKARNRFYTGAMFYAARWWRM